MLCGDLVTFDDLEQRLKVILSFEKIATFYGLYAEKLSTFYVACGINRAIYS